MKGHLLSENAEMIVFKDDKGLQYSLKKTILDLDKMKDGEYATSASSSGKPVPEPVEVDPEIQTQPSPETLCNEPKSLQLKHRCRNNNNQSLAPLMNNPYAKSLHDAHRN